MILWKTSKNTYGTRIFHVDKACLERAIKANSKYIRTLEAHPVQVEMNHFESYQRLCSRCGKGIKL